MERIVIRGPWDVLSSGARLVDAPSLQAASTHRREMARKVLARADAVLLTCNTRRATNDTTAQDMLPLDLRRLLCGRGVPCELAFVATQTDVLVRSEIVQSLKLPEDTNMLGCAMARNAFTKKRLTESFFLGVPCTELPVNQERPSSGGLNGGQIGGEIGGQTDEPSSLSILSTHMTWNDFQIYRRGTSATPEQWRAHNLAAEKERERTSSCHGERTASAGGGSGVAGASGGAAAIDTFSSFTSSSSSTSGVAAGFDFPVFTVSAVDAQKLEGVRSDDGPPAMFHSIRDTELNALRGFVVGVAARKSQPLMVPLPMTTEPDGNGGTVSLPAFRPPPGSSPSLTSLVTGGGTMSTAAYRARVVAFMNAYDTLLTPANIDDKILLMAQSQPTGYCTITELIRRYGPEPAVAKVGKLILDAYWASQEGADVEDGGDEDEEFKAMVAGDEDAARNQNTAPPSSLLRFKSLTSSTSATASSSLSSSSVVSEEGAPSSKRGGATDEHLPQGKQAGGAAKRVRVHDGEAEGGENKHRARSLEVGGDANNDAANDGRTAADEWDTFRHEPSQQPSHGGTSAAGKRKNPPPSPAAVMAGGMGGMPGEIGRQSGWKVGEQDGGLDGGQDSAVGVDGSADSKRVRRTVPPATEMAVVDLT